MSNGRWGGFGEWPVSLAEATLGQLMVSSNKTSAKEPRETVVCRGPCSLLLFPLQPCLPQVRDVSVGLLGTGCHRQLSDAVSKAAGTTMNPTPSVPSPDLKHSICQSEQVDTGRTCVLIILRVAFPGTLSESQYARRMGSQSVYMPCGTPPQTLHSAPGTEFRALPF